MFDTVHLWLGQDSVSNSLLAEVPNLNLTHIGEHSRDGHLSITGNLENLRISISNNGISAKGSLPKFYLGDNFQTLQRQDISNAIGKLSDEMHLDFNQAKVTRLDMAQNLLMSYPPGAYYKFLGNCCYYKRLEQPESILYVNSQRQIHFYNKVAEAKHRRLEIPPVWSNQNVLRYEYRMIKRVSKRLKMDLRISDLSNENIYIDLVNKYIEQYKEIIKFQKSTIELKNIKSPKDVHKQILAMAYSRLGQEAFEIVEELRLLNAFDKKEYYSRLKKDIKELASIGEVKTDSEELVQELDQKILAIKTNYR